MVESKPVTQRRNVDAKGYLVTILNLSDESVKINRIYSQYDIFFKTRDGASKSDYDISYFSNTAARTWEDSIGNKIVTLSASNNRIGNRSTDEFFFVMYISEESKDGVNLKVKKPVELIVEYELLQSNKLKKHAVIVPYLNGSFSKNWFKGWFEVFKGWFKVAYFWLDC